MTTPIGPESGQPPQEPDGSGENPDGQIAGPQSAFPVAANPPGIPPGGFGYPTAGDGEPEGSSVASQKATWWKVATAVLAVLTLTLFAINLVLRQDVTGADDTLAAAEASNQALQEDLAAEQAKIEQLTTQLSTADERLSSKTDQLAADKKKIKTTEKAAKEAAQAQKRAEAELKDADTRLERAQAQLKAANAKLLNAQICSQGALEALNDIHSFPDIETGAAAAEATLDSVASSCKAALQ